MDDLGKAFASAARAELNRVERLLADVPDLQKQRIALMVLCQAYGVPVDAEGQKQINNVHATAIVIEGALTPEQLQTIRTAGPTAVQALSEEETAETVTPAEPPAPVEPVEPAPPLKSISAASSPKVARPVTPPPKTLTPAEVAERMRAKRDAEKKTAAPLGPPTASVAASNGELKDFAHGSRVTQLTIKEWRFVAQVYRVMGQGFMPYQKIISAVFKDERLPADARLWCSTAAENLRDRLASIGLELSHFAHQGYSIRELA